MQSPPVPTFQSRPTGQRCYPGGEYCHRRINTDKCNKTLLEKERNKKCKTTDLCQNSQENKRGQSKYNQNHISNIAGGRATTSRKRSTSETISSGATQKLALVQIRNPVSWIGIGHLNIFGDWLGILVSRPALHNQRGTVFTTSFWLNLGVSAIVYVRWVSPYKTA